MSKIQNIKMNVIVKSPKIVVLCSPSCHSEELATACPDLSGKNLHRPWRFTYKILRGSTIFSKFYYSCICPSFRRDSPGGTTRVVECFFPFCYFDPSTDLRAPHSFPSPYTTLVPKSLYHTRSQAPAWEC